MRAGDRAWLALAAGVIAWDLSCGDGEMLSDAALRYRACRPRLTFAVIAITAFHLAGVTPAPVDPFHWPTMLGVTRRRAPTKGHT